MSRKLLGAATLAIMLTCAGVASAQSTTTTGTGGTGTGVTTGTTGTGGTTGTPGTPNTGAGGNAAQNEALLGASASVATLGALYLLAASRKQHLSR